MKNVASAKANRRRSLHSRCRDKGNLSRRSQLDHSQTVRRFSLFHPQPVNDILTHGPPDRPLEALERSKAQIAAGETVPLEPFLDDLRASITRMRHRRKTPQAP